MNKGELYNNVIKRMKNFNISFDEAKKEIKEMYPQYTDILDELVEPGKTNIEISNILWEEITNLMYIASGNSYKSSEENIQRQLGLVIYLFNKEFNLWN
jgi:polyhydroxyalkanoate synthesis regulator phasin